MQSREAAFLALLHALKDGKYISDFLQDWSLKEHPDSQDFHLAQQIAYGSAQMMQSLDYLVLQASEKKKVHLKLKERVLLRTAFYQLHYLDRIPAYAVIDESMKIAKKYCHRYFVAYLYATLRKFSNLAIKLPQGQDIQSVGIRYSYPAFFVHELSENYGYDDTIRILEAGNRPSKLMARARNNAPLPKNWKIIMKDPQVVQVPGNELDQVIYNENFYIQNVTPVYLLGHLCKQTKKNPDRVLDMCAAPGGKSLALHDFFPKAKLYANDVSEEKIYKLRENFNKYHIDVSLSCSPGQNLEFEEKFDLIILDAPCSNSGVLNKRPEARWRLTEDHYTQLKTLQKELLSHAVKLLKPEGEIWYMTCSILPRENEDLILEIYASLGLEVRSSMHVLPNEEGWDGGYACCLGGLNPNV